jgi:hypothetical protein
MVVRASQSAQTGRLMCPMHPDVRSNDPGTCPICGMALVPADPLAAREYDVEIDVGDRGAVAGQPFRLAIAVRDPDTHAIVREFTEVHEKLFHMFVISQDLTHYDHVHPEQQADGTWALDVTLPRPGYYKIYSDFLPAGGTPQVIARPLVTRGFDGDLASSSASLVPDGSLRGTAGRMSVALQLPPTGLVAGRQETFVYTITDLATGEAVNDIQPYLGAWGHSVIMSEDTVNLVHAHPAETLPAPDEEAGGGPTLTFKALLPKPGTYRIWTQLKRDDVVSTVAFTVAVASPATE